MSENRPVSCGKIEQPALFLGEGRIEIDKTATLGYFPSPYFYSGYQHIEARSKDAAVFVGAGTFLNNNAVVIAERAKITIGKNCLIGTNFRCLSSDFHGVDPDAREVYKSADIQVGDNVFVGNDVVILKGVTIGAGTTIAAGAVVTRSFPPKSVIAGNPAKLIKTIGE
ncbi:MAG: acyltransferase [Opitutales bacterium]|nr:acyltransferase [Opitutales bacterium]